MTANALEASHAASGETNRFRDGDKIGAWARNSVEHVLKLGIMRGKTAVSFALKDGATRTEAAVIEAYAAGDEADRRVGYSEKPVTRTDL